MREQRTSLAPPPRHPSNTPPAPYAPGRIVGRACRGMGRRWASWRCTTNGMRCASGHGAPIWSHWSLSGHPSRTRMNHRPTDVENQPLECETVPTRMRRGTPHHPELDVWLLHEVLSGRMPFGCLYAQSMTRHNHGQLALVQHYHLLLTPIVPSVQCGEYTRHLKDPPSIVIYVLFVGIVVSDNQKARRYFSGLWQI